MFFIDLSLFLIVVICFPAFPWYLKFWGKVNGKSLFLATFGNFWQFLATFHMNFLNFQKKRLPKIAMDTPLKANEQKL